MKTDNTIKPAKPIKLCSRSNWPGCSGDPACCPENEGYGCGRPNPKRERPGCSECGGEY